MLGLDGNPEARVEISLGGLAVGGQLVVQTQGSARRNLPGTQTVRGGVLDEENKSASKRVDRQT